MSLLLLMGDSAPNTRSLFANNEAGLALDVGDRYGASESKRTWRRNLLTYSEQFDNAAWTKSNSATVTQNTSTAPDGTTTADTIEAGTTGANRQVSQTFALTSGNQRTFSCYLKAATTSVAFLQVSDNVANATGRYFDLLNGTSGGQTGLTAGTTVTLDSSSVTSVGSGWYRCQVTVSVTASTNFLFIAGIADANNSATATAGKTIIAWGAQLEVGSTPTDYQPISDFNTEFKAAFPTHSLYVDSNGAAPSVYPGDQVGLILDTSRGGLDSLGSELLADTGFDNSGSWDKSSGVTISGGVAVWNTAGTSEYVRQSNIVTQNKWYAIEIDCTAYTSGILYFAYTDGGTQISSIPINTVKTYRFFVHATAGSGRAWIITPVGGAVATISRFSVREIPGNHAYQTNGSQRPALARTPDGGRRNLLTYSEELDNAAWTKANVTVTANNSADPIGTTTADRVVETAATGEHRVQNTAVLSVTAGTVYTASIYAKAGEVTILRIGFDDQAKLPARVFFNLSNGTVSFTEAGAGTITSVGNGWYRCTITGTCGTSHSSRVELNLVQTGTTASYAGNTSNGLLLWGAQYETGSSATAYQKVGLTSDVTESGKRDCWGLLFDGSDDSLQTSEISFNTWTQATRRNLLTDTESFGTSNWVNNGGTVTENTTVAPDGTTTADTLTRSSNALDGRYQTVTFTGDGVKAVSFYVKKGTANGCGLWLFDSTASANRILASVDLSGSVPVATITAGTDFAYSDAGNGWWRISMLSTTVTAANTNRVYLFAARGTGTADGETSIFWGVQAENANAPTDYQRVGTDKMTVMAGARKNSDATAIVVELTTNLTGNSGSFYLVSGQNATDGWWSASRGNAVSAINQSASIATSSTDTAVISSVHDISGDLTTIRRNSVAGTDATGDKGSGNFSNAILYIGSRAGSSLRLNGLIYTLIIRGATTPTGTIADFEKNLLRLRAGMGAF